MPRPLPGMLRRLETSSETPDTSMNHPPKVWLITGISRGLGLELARAVLAKGDLVIGTARSGKTPLPPETGRLHVLPLDLTVPAKARKIVEIAHSIHGRLDVVVNNAGYGLLGAIEECSPEEFARLFDVNFFGPLHLIQAVLPILREQRSGHIVNLSSIAGVAPGAGSGLYAASKFALEGMSQVLAQEVKPLGIKVTVVEPGVFRTDFLDPTSIHNASSVIPDYASTSGKTIAYLDQLAGKQQGDPVKAAEAIIRVVESPEPPLQLLLGSDALNRAQARFDERAEEIKQWHSVTTGTDLPASA
ncbi:MAG: short-chain dehydrogenase [Akkermansiaceae bacterium]|nr:short-chain dehydrogenase [Akkermansiaceae bacterium]